MIEEKDYCIDIPDDRDFSYELLGEAKELPNKFLLLADEIQNQKLDGWPYGCVYYGGSSGANITNDYSKNDIKIKGSDLCNKAVELGYLDIEKGSSLQNGRKLLKDDKYIEGYFKVEGLSNMKQTLTNHSIIYTGSNKIARRKMLSDCIVVRGEGYGHCFIIVGYDDEKGYFSCQNSYGSESYDKGYFYIKYEDIDILFTCYTFEVNQKNILLYKEKIMENLSPEESEAFQLGIWNGLDGEKSASRKDVAKMILRGLKKLKNNEI